MTLNEILTIVLAGGGGAVLLEVVRHILGRGKRAENHEDRDLKQAADWREELRRENDRLRDTINELRSRLAVVEQKLTEYYDVHRDNIDLTSEIEMLNKRVAELEAKLEQYDALVKENLELREEIVKLELRVAELEESRRERKADADSESR